MKLSNLLPHPSAILSRFVPHIPVESRQDMETLLQFMPYAAALKRPDPPAGFAKLMEPIAAGHGIPPLLLAAISAVLSNHDPALNRAGRAGLLAVPSRVWKRVRSEPDFIVWDPENPERINPIRMNILLCSQWLRRYADRDGYDLAGAVIEWCRPGAESGNEKLYGTAGDVAADYLFRAVDTARAGGENGDS